MGIRISILLSVILSVGNITIAQLQTKELSNEVIWASNELSTEYVYAVNSMNDGEHYSALEDNKIVKYSFTDFGKVIDVIFDGNNHDIEIDDYSFSADESKLLISTEQESIYRRSSKSNYLIVNMAEGIVTKLYNEGRQMLADFSPDGTKVAFVFQNNIYVKDLDNNKIEQITKDGVPNRIINGSADWVYEEEFELTKAFHWSPKGTKIAYLKFDETEVPEFSMDYHFGGTYPSIYTFKYPKAGEKNAKVSLHIHNLESGNTTKVQVGDYEYVPRLKWTNDDDKLVFLTMNRHQNELHYVMSTMNEKGGADGKIFYTDKSETYVEVDHTLYFLKDEEALLKTSEKDGFNHIYKIDFNGKETQITKGEWDVVDLKGVNEDDGRIYYTSAEEGAMYKSLYTINLKGSKKQRLSSRLGTNEAVFSEGMKYYMNYYSNANEPYTITVHNSKGKEISVLKDNAILKKKIKKYGFSTKEFIKIKGAKDSLNAFIIKPSNFDSSKKYPVYFNIYNGPGSNMVEDSWAGRNLYYHQLLAQKGYIVISVDTRGTMYRGADFKKSTYLQLGKLETEDMIAVAQEVQNWKYVDKNRVGIMGWSYGGYMTALCMTKGADLFKMGIAVAPVTNWRWYDSIYTERFMRTPQENANGYDDNSPINHVDKLKGAFLLVHGSGDDNVHVQNSMELANALIHRNVPFDFFVYPNKNHGIYGGKTRLHLFNKMLKFTEENL